MARVLAEVSRRVQRDCFAMPTEKILLRKLTLHHTAHNGPWRGIALNHGATSRQRAAAATSFSIGAPTRLPHSVQDPS